MARALIGERRAQSRNTQIEASMITAPNGPKSSFKAKATALSAPSWLRLSSWSTTNSDLAYLGMKRALNPTATTEARSIPGSGTHVRFCGSAC